MFELFQSDNDQKYYWNLKAGNGEVILSSEGYSDKSGAVNGIESVKTNCGDDNCFEKKTASNGQEYFVMKARNGKVIGRSEMYKSTSGMNNGIDSIKRNAPGAEIKERS